MFENMNIKEQIDQLGYALLPGLITAEECDHYKLLLEDNYRTYAPLHASNTVASTHGLDDKSKEKVVYNLHNKDLSWYKLFTHPEVLKVLDGMLLDGSYMNSEPYYLYNISARCPLKDNPGQQLHLDSRLPGLNHCIVANVLWALDDFTIQNGATRVVPGSHKFRSFAEDGKVYDEEITLTCKKGSAIIFNANLWHGGGGNFDGSSRWALALGYARWFIKPAFDYMKNMPKDIYDQLTLEQKNIMGFTCVPPKDEFTRVRRRSIDPEIPEPYKLPL
jgi:ectoine hydroxylase-related dioxygenase (phytanoyl-CoA dioxygenase family)